MTSGAETTPAHLALDNSIRKNLSLLLAASGLSHTAIGLTCLYWTIVEELRQLTQQGKVLTGFEAVALQNFFDFIGNAWPGFVFGGIYFGGTFLLTELEGLTKYERARKMAYLGWVVGGIIAALVVLN
jgi:hypothetical protein